MGVFVYQCDNRPSLDYLQRTRKVNETMCKLKGYTYIFEDLTKYIKENMHPACSKIYAVNELLKTLNNDDIIVFLDSDAWIQNHHNLELIITYLKNSEFICCISKDNTKGPELHVNSGSFILKKNKETVQMYNYLENRLNTDPIYHNIWGYDQGYITEYVRENLDKVAVFSIHILNGPSGNTLRHNWKKNKKMWIDIKYLLNNIPKYSTLTLNF